MHTIKQLYGALNPAERRILGVSGALLAAGIAVAFFFWFWNATLEAPASGGTLTEGMVGQPTYVNPVLAESEPDRALTHLVFANAFDIAEKTEADESGKIWKMRLREDLRWSDGRKLTSDDLIFSIQRIQETETRSPLAASWQGVTVNRVSEIELQFVLASPYPFFTETLRNLYPLPKHLFADTPPANWRLTNYNRYNLEPVGNGPYRFSSYELRSDGYIERYTLERNETYHGTPPLLDRIIIRFFPRTEDLVKAFNNGSVDAFGKFDPEVFARIERSHRIVAYPVPSYYAVFLNQGQNLALKDPAVRSALQYAIDREALVRDIFDGRARIAHGPFIAAERSGETKDDWYRIVEARSILETNGWSIASSSVREKTVKGSVIPLSFDLIVPQIAFLEKTAERLRTSWEALGARINLVIMPPEEIAGAVLKNREYQAVLFGNYLNPPYDLYPFWHTNERFAPGLNLSLMSDRRVDERIERMRREMDDAARAEIQAELQTFITESAPAIFLYSPNFQYAMSRNVKGVTPELLAEPADRLTPAGAWHLKTTRAFK